MQTTLMTVSDLARHQGVNKALISRRVKAFGLRTEPGPYGAKLVNVSEYDRALRRARTIRVCAEFIERLRRSGKLGKLDTKTGEEIYRALQVAASAGAAAADDLLSRLEKDLEGASESLLVMLTSKTIVA
jgi:hypothetical protein